MKPGTNSARDLDTAKKAEEFLRKYESAAEIPAARRASENTRAGGDGMGRGVQSARRGGCRCALSPTTRRTSSSR
jgi:hypothetical protein